MLDLILIAVLLLAAVSGWRRGLITAGLGAAGFLVGGLIGLHLVPGVVARVGAFAESEVLRVVVHVAGVLLLAAVGSIIGEAVGRAIARAIDIGPIRAVDALLGAVGVAAITALVMWLVASSIRPALPAGASAALAESRTLTAIDTYLPDRARTSVTRFRATIEGSGFPEVFDALTPEPIAPVREPDANAGQTAGVRAAAASIVEIRAIGSACATGMTGSGWVVAPQRVATNAHVVAGTDQVSVQVTGRGDRLEATVVAFDPELDMAILAVPDLDAAPLARVAQVPDGSDGVVAGFPGGGDYTLSPAVVRGEFEAMGYDIHSRDRVLREIYSLRTTVRPGNSGGPLLTTDGTVAGTIFARSHDDAQTGYAITDEAADAILDGAAGASSPVATGSCVAA